MSGNCKKNVKNEEKRKHKRITEHFFIFYNINQNSDDLNFWTHQAGSEQNVTQNIGGGGIMVEREHLLPLYGELPIQIYVPLDVKRKNIIAFFALGRVRWAEEIGRDNYQPGSNRYRIGIEFIKINQEAKNCILECIEERAFS